MMNNSICRLFAGIWAFLLLSSAPGHAWGPIAHYLLTKGVATNVEEEAIAPYANLPDAWPANHDWPDYGLTIEVTDYFCWSHAAKNGGVWDLENSPIEIPKEPQYADDGREPGKAMKVLVEEKLDFNKNAWGEKSDLQLAYKGFIAHNAADRVVHWSYFRAATDEHATREEKQDAWTIHHGLKETWAEYVLLERMVFKDSSGAPGEILFNSDGSIALPTGSGINLAIPQLNAKITAMAKLFRLSQKVYNKNRTQRHVDDDSAQGLSVQSIDAITELLQAQNNRLQNYFSLGNWAKWEVPVLGLNFVHGQVAVENENNVMETMDFDTPRNLKIEWGLLKEVAKKYGFYKNTIPGQYDEAKEQVGAKLKPKPSEED